MQLTKNQKEIAILVVLVIATLAVLGSFFLKNAGNSDYIVDEGSIPSDVVVQGVDAAGAASSASDGYSFLPGGFDVDLDVLNDARFRGLVPPSYPVVEQSEIGNQNLFAQ